MSSVVFVSLSSVGYVFFFTTGNENFRCLFESFCECDDILSSNVFAACRLSLQVILFHQILSHVLFAIISSDNEMRNSVYIYLYYRNLEEWRTEYRSNNTSIMCRDSDR